MLETWMSLPQRWIRVLELRGGGCIRESWEWFPWERHWVRKGEDCCHSRARHHDERCGAFR